MGGREVTAKNTFCTLSAPNSAHFLHRITMRKPTKTVSGKWRQQVEFDGKRDSATFNTQREALEWGAQRLVEIRAAAKGGVAGAKLHGETKTLNDAMRKYKEEVSPDKRGWRWEQIRIEAITSKHPKWPGERIIVELDEQDLIQWKNARRRSVKDSTVLREMALVNNVLEFARKEWHWISRNPMTDVSKPSTPHCRERVIDGVEIRKMLREMEWSRSGGVTKAKQVAARCFIAALQTGMRAGEVTKLRWKDVRKNYCVLHRGQTKTGMGRNVPLTRAALRNLESMRGHDDEFVFAMDASVLDALFRRNRQRAGLEGFTFHDSRHTAATRMAQKLHVLDLCKVFGWTDPKRAMTYYNPTADQIADRLEGVA